MRAEALRALADLAEKDERIVFLTGDLGFGVVEPFFERFPDRAFNVGVAEQNMLAMAAGLAEAGLIPFVYSIATFAVLRPLEFIRNGPVHQMLKVRIIGVGGGMEYSNNGPSHLALEDIGVLRSQPGLAIMCPNSTPQARSMIEATWDQPGPIYYRLSKQHIQSLEGLPDEWGAAGGHVLRVGTSGVALVALGAAASELTVASAALNEAAISATTVAISRVAPAPVDLLHRIASTHRLIAVIESHYINGGLGSLMCEVVAESGAGCRVIRCGVESIPVGRAGSLAYLLQWAGIDGASIARRVVDAVAGPEDPIR